MNDASGDVDADVDALVSDGRYEEAAALSVARGDREGAIRLYTRIWNFAAAWPLAAQLGDWPRAVRLALDARDPTRALALAESVPRESSAVRVACAEALASRGLHAEAAALAEAAGDYERAINYYKRARDLLGAGGAEERAGRPHEALNHYEAAARTAGSAREQARARLAAGHLLARLGHRREAIRALQAAAREPSGAWQTQAWRALQGPLTDEGLPAAAAELKARLRHADPLGATHTEGQARQGASPDARQSAPQDASPSASASPPPLPLLAADEARFRVLRELGSGSAARVVMAEDRLLGRAVALKIVQSGGSTPSQRLALAAFHREAEAAARLRHPTIVALLDVDRAQGIFVLEWMAGGTLADRLARESRLTAAAARRLALDLLDALDVAHAHGIIHRDVKPANVFFDEAGNAKLGDFGSAHLMDFGQTQTGGLLGTVAYMAPEQITAGSASPATDVYAMGVLLFEALTGALPFVGPDIVASHLGEAPRPLRSLRPQLSSLHESTLDRALAKDPGSRFPSARAMRDEIRRWAEREDPEDIEDIEDIEDTADTETASRRMQANPGAEAQRPTVLPRGRTLLGATPHGIIEEDAETSVGLTAWIETRTTAEVVLEPATTEASRQADVLARAPAENLAAPQAETLAATFAKTLASLRALAAAGGPCLQRILDIAPNAQTVTYEPVEGAPGPWPLAPSPALVAAATLVQSTCGQAPPFVYLTRGGYVVPCVWLADGRPPK